MKNFLRALRCSWPYRGRLCLSVVCAVLAAVLWSLNFTAIYPFLHVLGKNHSMQDWVNSCIAKTNEEIDSWQAKVDALTRESKKLDNQPPSGVRDTLQRKLASGLAKNESQLESCRHELYRYQLAKKYIDMLFPQDLFQTLALVVGLVVVAVAVRGFFEFWQESLVGSVVNMSLFDLRNRFYRNAIHLDVNNFSEEGSHELMARFTNDMELLGAGTKTLFGKVVAEPLKALACVVFACWISWQLTLMFLVLVPVALFILTKVGRLMKRATRRLLERMSNIYKILQETFQGIRVVKAFTMEPYERRRFCSATKDYYHKAMWVVNLDALSGPIIELLGVAAVAAALLAGAYLVLTPGQTHLFGMRMTTTPLEPESLLQLYALLAAIADPVRKLSSVYTRIQSGAAAADRIFAYVDRQPRVQPNSAGKRLARHSSAVELREVCFSYEPGRPILTNVSLHVRFGETVALVGKNGCGKTTLVGLIPRFFDADHGSVLVDDVDVRSANLRSLRQQIGIVTQEAILFSDTIYNNIAYGCRRARAEDVERAAQQAFAHDFIMKLPAGYQTRLGEAGAKLSGGEKQRLALARAILRDPSILILDEFTSQSDPENEVRVHNALREFMRNRTSFVITHRLNTLEIADRIVVVDGGRIAAVGTHQELLASCLVYQRLHEAQFQRLVA
jgi:ATP-binding cassette subfamily B protein/subfamily B ATP-binding cassette protein MsbA